VGGKETLGLGRLDAEHTVNILPVLVRIPNIDIDLIY
jgi:hypothetical protein